MPRREFERNPNALPRNRFEPSAWSHVYSDPAPTPSQRLFRRVTDEVYAAARPLCRPRQTWLDLGCGTGELAASLAHTGISMYGLDHDPEMLLWTARSAADRASKYLIAGDACRLPFADRSVDGVVGASLTGCLGNLESLWIEISRVLSPGGNAVLSFTNADSVLLSASSHLRRRKRRTNANHPCHGTFHRYRIPEVIDSASSHGLALDSIRHFNCFIDLDNRSLPGERLAHLFETSGSHWINRRLCRNFVTVLRSTTRSRRVSEPLHA